MMTLRVAANGVEKKKMEASTVLEVIQRELGGSRAVLGR